MKKLNFLTLLFTALLVSGSVWGGTVHEVSTFSELTTAISSAVAGDEIKLTAPITTTTQLNISKAITLNLGGFTLSNSNLYTMIVTNGNVTIKGNDDGVTPLGSIVNSKSQSTTIETDGGTLNIISGTIRNSGAYPTVILNAYASSITIGSDASIEGSTSYLSSGYTHIWNTKANASFTINNSGITFGGQAATNIINNGTMSFDYKGSYSAVTNNGTMVVNGGTFAAGSITNNGTLTIEGGLFAKSDYESIIGYVAPGKELWETKNYVSVQNVGATVKAKIGEYAYTSYGDAYGEASAGDEIDLYADLTQYTCTIAKNITIDLNGYNWTFLYNGSYQYGVFLNTSTNATIKNSQSTGQLIGYTRTNPICINSSAHLTLEDINVSFPKPTYCVGERILLKYANASLTIRNSTISSSTGSTSYAVIYGKIGTTSITIENSTINANEYKAVYAKGPLTCTNTTIDCDGSSASDIYGIFMEGTSANLTFNSGSITVNNSGTGNNATGIALWGNGPTANINGGTITSDKFAVAGNGSSTTNSIVNITGGTLNSLNGSAIYHPQTGTLNISGTPTITGQNTALEIRSGTANITGGTLISRYQINEEETSPNGNGTTTVGVGVAVVQHVTTNPITVTVSDSAVIHALLPVKLANPQANEEVKINTVEVYMNGGKSAAINGASTVFKSITSNFFVSAGKFSHVPSYVVEGKTVISNPDDDKDVYPYMIGVVSNTTNDAQGTTGDIIWEIDENWKLNGESTQAIPVSTDNVTVAAGQNVIVTGKKEGTGDQTDGAFAYSINIAAGGSLVVDSGAVLVVGGGGITNNSGTSGILVKDGGTLLISPDADSIEAHPYGGIQFKSVTAKHEDGWEKWYERDHRFQLIGIPTMEQPEIIRGNQGSKDNKIYLNTWDINSGWIAVTSLEQFNTPFKGYCFWNDAKDTLDADPTEIAKLKDSVDYNVLYTFKGRLVGNKQNLMQFQQDGYHFFANSYTAPIDIYSLLAGAENGVQKAVYILLPLEYKYEDVNYAKLSNPIYEYRTIAPMQGFFFLKTTEGTGTAPIDYVSTVWSPSFPGGATPSAMVAPRKQSMSEMTSVRISLTDNTKHRCDNVYLMASDMYSAQLDASDTRKMMNPAMGVNIYAPSNLGNLSTMQTYDLEGQYLAITTNAATFYTLSFDWVKGEELYLTDHVTGQTTLMQEGNTYTFSAESNATIPDRFEIVRSMPGVVTNVEPIANPAKNIHGIYTMMGQYVGESSNWDMLPNGVYVVNGQKVVK